VEINGTWGQITIDHGNGYRTTYTHMQLNLPLPQTVSKGQHIGWVSNIGPGTVGVHLHFVAKRYKNGTWTLVDPYGGSGEPVLWE
jgi:murein DD-endopeptidase MepM/ murein hydrolase activator NlpD